MSTLQGHIGLLLRNAFIDQIASKNNESTGSSIMLGVWNVMTGAKLPFPDGTGSNASVARASGRYSADGSYLVVGGRGTDYVRIYDASTRAFIKGKDYSAFSTAIDCRAIDISPNNQFVAVGSASPISGSAFHVFNFADMSEVTLGASWAGGNPLSIRFSPDSSLCAIANQGSNLLTIYETATWTRITTGITPTIINYVAEFSPDGTHLVVGFGSSPYFRVYATSDWSLVKTPTGAEIPGTIIRGCAFSLNGQKMVVSTESTIPFAKVYEPALGYTLNATQPSLTSMVGVRGVSFNRTGTEFALGHNIGSGTTAITRINTDTMAVLTPLVGGTTNSDWVAYNR